MTKYISNQTALSFDKWDCSLVNPKYRGYSNLKKSDFVKDTVTINADGSIHLQFLFPKALFVSALINKKVIKLKRRGKYFCCDVNLENGISRIMLMVNGKLTLYEYLPMAVISNTVCNYIEIIEEGSFYDEKTPIKGSLNHHIIYNNVKEKNDRLIVYIPYEYYHNNNKKYDVIYLQHGFGENEMGWSLIEKVNVLMDNMIYQKKSSPRIIVMANGFFRHFEDDKAIFEPYRFVEYLTSDIIPYIEKTYRVSSNRYMAGLSMGSIQTSMCALEKPELFKAIGLFSGFLSDPLTNLNKHLNDKKIEAFIQSKCRLFRSIGNDDKYLPIYLSDEKIIEEKKIPCTSKRYEGGHDPNVWRQAMIDFLKFIEN